MFDDNDIHVWSFSLFAAYYCYPSNPSHLVQGHTAVTVGTDMIIFGGIVNGQRVDEVFMVNTNSLR